MNVKLKKNSQEKNLKKYEKLMMRKFFEYLCLNFEI